MKKLITAVTAAACMTFGSAHAVLIDFAQEAVDNGERGLAFGAQLTINGIDMVLKARENGVQGNPYLDGPLGDRPGGLGECSQLDMNAQCVPASDDNVSTGEMVNIEFFNDNFTDNVLVNINSLVFRNFEHLELGAGAPGGDGMVQIRVVDINGVVTTMNALFSQFIAMAANGDAFFQNIVKINFQNMGTQFYVSALDVSEVPIPAALPLLLSGLAGLGFASRRRKAA